MSEHVCVFVHLHAPSHPLPPTSISISLSLSLSSSPPPPLPPPPPPIFLSTSLSFQISAGITKHMRYYANGLFYFLENVWECSSWTGEWERGSPPSLSLFHARTVTLNLSKTFPPGAVREIANVLISWARRSTDFLPTSLTSLCDGRSSPHVKREQVTVQRIHSD